MPRPRFNAPPPYLNNNDKKKLKTTTRNGVNAYHKIYITSSNTSQRVSNRQYGIRQVTMKHTGVRSSVGKKVYVPAITLFYLNLIKIPSSTSLLNDDVPRFCRLWHFVISIIILLNVFKMFAYKICLNYNLDITYD